MCGVRELVIHCTSKYCVCNIVWFAINIVLYIRPQENLFLLPNWNFVHYASEWSQTRNKTLQVFTLCGNLNRQINRSGDWMVVSKGWGGGIRGPYGLAEVLGWPGSCGIERWQNWDFLNYVFFLSLLPIQCSFHVFGCWWWWWWVMRRTCILAFIASGNNPQVWV